MTQVIDQRLCNAISNMAREDKVKLGGLLLSCEWSLRRWNYDVTFLSSELIGNSLLERTQANLALSAELARADLYVALYY